MPKLGQKLIFLKKRALSVFKYSNYLPSCKKNRKKLIPVGNYMFKVDNRNTRTRCEICSKLTMKTQERRHCSGVFIVNFEHISSVSIVNFEQVNADWDDPFLRTMPN